MGTTPTLNSVAALGERLRDAGFDEAHLRVRLRQRAVLRTTAPRVALAERRAGDDALGRAIRFWQLGLPTDVDTVPGAGGSADLPELEALGLVRRHPRGWIAALAISPVRDLLVTHDFDDGSGFAVDHVVGVGPAALTLASLTPRTQVGRLLDVGTGGGVQALLGSAHADTVVATDISERALEVARLSAALSAIEGIEFRLGDGAEPVAGETFDLVVSNPPFVISPDTDFVFRDGGGPEPGDHLSRRMVRQVAPLLGPDGTAVVLVNWIVRDAAGLTAAPREWISDLGCDALILQHDTLDPLAYAQRWMMLAEGADLDAQRSTLARWVDGLDALDARLIAAGAIVLRQRNGEPRMRVARFPKRPDRGGPQVERMLQALGQFTGPSDPTLAETVFRLVEGQRLEQRLAFGRDEFEAGDAVLRLDRSAGVLGSVPAEQLEALFEIDGQRSLARVAGDFAEVRAVPAADVLGALAPVVLELFELGFLDEVGPS
jgi:SAM-dependent methyltransferase